MVLIASEGDSRTQGDFFDFSEDADFGIIPATIGHPLAQEFIRADDSPFVLAAHVYIVENEDNRLALMRLHQVLVRDLEPLLDVVLGAACRGRPRTRKYIDMSHLVDAVLGA
jgi:hypothetical protein